MADTVRPVTPFMDEDYEAHSTVFTVCFIECMAVRSSDERTIGPVAHG